MRPAALLLAGGGAIFGALFGGAVAAQEPPPLSISKAAERPAIVAGENLVYVITVTNTGPSPVADLVVRDAVPAGTTFVRSDVFNAGWYTGGAEAGAAGDAVWLGLAPLSGGEVITVSLEVAVASEATGVIVNSDYEVRSGAAGAPVRGEPVTVQIVVPTPAPTSTPAPSPAPTETPTATPAPATPTETPNPTPSPIPPSPAGQAERPPSTMPLLLAGLVLVAAVVAASAWTLRGRRRME